MDFSKVSYEEILAKANELSASSQNMKELLDEIKVLFAQVGTEETWSGTSASSTKDRFDALSAKFPEFSKAVDDCSKYLVSMVENYKNMDSSVMGQQ